MLIMELSLTFAKKEYILIGDCSDYGATGGRDKHRFACKMCGIQLHRDLHVSQNIRRIVVSADAATGIVNYPNVAA